jgi:hypothetical protein
MSDQTQNTEVVLDLKVKTSDGAKAMKDLAAGTREAGAAAKGTQKEFDALAEAQKRLEAVDKERAIKQQMRQLRPEPPPLPFDPHLQARRQIQGAEQSRQIEQARREIEERRQASLPWYARQAGSFGGVAGMAMRAAPLIGAAYAAGKVVTSAGSAAGEIGDLAAQRAMSSGGGVSANEAASLFGKHLLEGIPILGGFVKSIGDAGYALSGIPAIAAMTSAGLTVLGRQMQAVRAESAGRAQLAQTIYGATIHSGDATATANASAAYAASLTPGRLSSYREAYGGLTEAADQSASQVNAAREQLAVREREHAATLGQIRGMRPGVSVQGTDADTLQTAADRAQKARDDLRGQFFGRFQNFGGRITNAGTEATGNASGAQGLALEKSKQLGEQLALSQKQIADIEQKRVDLARAELGHAQALLAVKGQIAQGAEGRALQYGAGTPAQAMEDAQILRLIGQHGIGALPPELIARAQSIPGAAEILNPMIKRRGDQIGQPVRDALAELAPPGMRDQIRKPLAEQDDEVRKLRAEQGAASDQKQAAAAKDFAVGVGEAVTEAIKLSLDEVKREIKRQVNDQILMGKNN